MEYIEPAVIKNDLSIYRLRGEHEGKVKRFIISTPETRKLCNEPEVVGSEFTDLIKKAIVRVLKNYPVPEDISDLQDINTNVLHFLRGSLNFELVDALKEAYGFNLHSSSFMTSQRAKNPNGRWFIKDDQYQKFDFSRGATIFCGDIVATGSTIENGFDRLYKLAKFSGKPLQRVIFFTIGCHKLEKILENFHTRAIAAFKGYSNTTIFYLEGKFHLADSKTDVEIKVQGTDLLRLDCTLSPEFELSQYDKLSYPLERCVVYDAGSRKFNVLNYYEDVLKYWREVKLLSDQGWTLCRYLKNRWPEKEYETKKYFIKTKKKCWKGIDREFLDKLYSRYEARWSADFKKFSSTARSLQDICEQRFRELKPRIKKVSRSTLEKSLKEG